MMNRDDHNDFDISKTINYWLESAIYDLGVGKSLIDVKKFPYSLFFGHLALEKILKAAVVKNTKKHASYTHSLPLLASKSNLNIPENYLLKLREFMEFHIEARYPDARHAFYNKCTETYTQAKMNEMEEIFQWLKNQLEK